MKHFKRQILLMKQKRIIKNAVFVVVVVVDVVMNVENEVDEKQNKKTFSRKKKFLFVRTKILRSKKNFVFFR
jgi:hypothetical protein